MGKPPVPSGLFSLPGWHPDPSDPTRQWYWDGTDWTKEEARVVPPPAIRRHTLPKAQPKPAAQAPAPAPPPAGPPPRPPKVRKPIYWSRLTLGLLIRALIAGAVGAALINSLVVYQLVGSKPPEAVTAVLGVLFAALIFFGLVYVELRTSPDEIKCAKCGTKFKTGYTTCRKCGHTYS